MTRTRTFAFLTILFALMLAGCSEVAADQPSPVPAQPESPEILEQTTTAGAPINQQAISGVEGQAVQGPACPGPVRIDQPCPDVAYQAFFSIIDRDGEVLMRFQTAADGKFQVLLPPGKYILHPELESAFPTAQDLEFLVKPGEFTRLLVQFDSGMR